MASLSRDVSGRNHDRIISLFKTWDINGDSFIDRSELRSVIQILVPEFSSNIDKLLLSFDKNKDGKIDMQEFLEHITSSEVQSCVLAELHRLDYANDGSVTRAALEQVFQELCPGTNFELLPSYLRGDKIPLKEFVDYVFAKDFDVSEEKLLTGAAVLAGLSVGSPKQHEGHGAQVWQRALTFASSVDDGADTAASDAFVESSNQVMGIRRAIRVAIDEEKYTGICSIREALVDEDTVLIRGSWFIKQGQAGGVLPRRQELGRDAIWKPHELITKISSDGPYNRIVAISYCWIQADHPDPKGVQLRRIYIAVEKRLASDLAHEFDDLAIFMDWCSMYQRPYSTEEQEVKFRCALMNVNLWYAHHRTMVWLLTKVPELVRPYSQRGWPSFERAICHLLTDYDQVLDLGNVSESCTSWDEMVHSCLGSECRDAPATPVSFAGILKEKIFTNDSDHAFVSRKYAQTFEEAMGSARVLRFAGLGWDDQDMKHFAQALPYCGQLVILDLSSNKINDAGVALLAIALAACPTLQVLIISNNYFGGEGEARLDEAQSRHPNLQLVATQDSESIVIGASNLKGVVDKLKGRSQHAPDTLVVVCIYFWIEVDDPIAFHHEFLSDAMDSMKNESGVRSCAFSLSDCGQEMICKIVFSQSRTSKSCGFAGDSTVMSDAWRKLYAASEVRRIDVYGPRKNVDEMRKTLKEMRFMSQLQSFSSQFYPNLDDANCFLMPSKFPCSTRIGKSTDNVDKDSQERETSTSKCNHAVKDTTVLVMVHWRIMGPESVDAFYRNASWFAARTKTEPGVVSYGFSMCGQVAVCREVYDSGQAFIDHLKNVSKPLDACQKTADLTLIEVQGPKSEVEDLQIKLSDYSTKFYSHMHGVSFASRGSKSGLPSG